MNSPTREEGPDALELVIRSSLEQLCHMIDDDGRTLMAIGLVTTDDLLTVAVRLRFDGDFPRDAERYQLLSPVEAL